MYSVDLTEDCMNDAFFYNVMLYFTLTLINILVFHFTVVFLAFFFLFLQLRAMLEVNIIINLIWN